MYKYNYTNELVLILILFHHIHFSLSFCSTFGQSKLGSWDSIVPQPSGVWIWYFIYFRLKLFFDLKRIPKVKASKVNLCAVNTYLPWTSFSEFILRLNLSKYNIIKLYLIIPNWFKPMNKFKQFNLNFYLVDRVCRHDTLLAT